MRLDEGVDIPVNLPLSVSVAAKVISESEQDSLRSAIPPLCISCFPALCTRVHKAKSKTTCSRWLALVMLGMTRIRDMKGTRNSSQRRPKEFLV
ncbi:unnamed protein product [Arctogadus glacialis]